MTSTTTFWKKKKVLFSKVAENNLELSNVIFLIWKEYSDNNVALI